MAAVCAYRATKNSVLATRLTTTALCLGWSGAFAMHLAVSLRTRTVMPGVVTSVVPGLPGAYGVLRRIWG
ncbi:hypothetical protein [Phycicoccus endophyticus]|uniref:hypothetical protein n=1 Tax=Phycicoccus endophyticus TaxID=1690220 RepID=UPI001CB72CA9|nr:hypothetical protein [Phycicoccus endophyticus]